MILDLFCGIGWGQALHELGLSEHGIDHDPVVAETRALHGWATTTGDIAALNPANYPCEVLIASPPCQSFSAAGKRAGLDDPRGQLVWQVPRWALANRPRIVVCEQVPAVLPIWRTIGHELAKVGYSWWAGVLDAVQYGVPQTRKRAILIARRDGMSPLPPEPTHRPYRKGVAQGEGDPALLPWVSMADALGWGMTERPAVTLAPGTAKGGPDFAGGSAGRAAVYAERDAGRWMLQDRHPDRIRLTVEQGLILQSFPADFALAGTKTAQWRQIGNSVAPRFGRSLLAHVFAAHEAAACVAAIVTQLARGGW